MSNIKKAEEALAEIRACINQIDNEIGKLNIENDNKRIYILQQKGITEDQIEHYLRENLSLEEIGAAIEGDSIAALHDHCANVGNAYGLLLQINTLYDRFMEEKGIEAEEVLTW